MTSKARQLADLGGDTANLEDVSAAYNSGALSNRNKILNGQFDVWQRGTSFTSNAYTADRWYMSLGGSTGTVSQQSFTVGQTDVPNEPNKYLRFNISSYVGEFNLFQRIEDVRTLAGQTAILSFYMKADSALTVAPFMVQNFGSGGSSNVNSALSTISVTTSWQKFEISISIPSISGKTVGSSSYLQIMPLRVTSSFTGNIDIAQVQLEAGSVATPFEHRSYGQELALCQRYYFHVGEDASGEYTQFGQGRAYSSSNGNVIVQFPVPMRTKPTMDTGNAVAGDWDFGLTANPTAGSVPDSFTHMTVGAAASFTNGSIFVLGANSGTGGNAQLNFDAEL